MDLINKIFTIYPELTYADFHPVEGTLLLQNDLDGRGDYISKWNHPTLTKPTYEQLNGIQ